MKPIIGITSGEIINHLYTWLPVTYGQRFPYIDAVLNQGGVPIIIPILKDEETLRRIYEICDGILFAGGDDVNPKLYGETRDEKTEPPADNRDASELNLLKWSLEEDKPILCTCRGMQLLNVSLGGTLYQDINSQVPGTQDHFMSAAIKKLEKINHTINIEPDSHLASILEVKSIGANELHHQGVKDLGEGLRVSAKANDGIIEAIEMPGKRFVLGVQMHPESLESDIEPQWRKLYEAFVAASAGANLSQPVPQLERS